MDALYVTAFLFKDEEDVRNEKYEYGEQDGRKRTNRIENETYKHRYSRRDDMTSVCMWEIEKEREREREREPLSHEDRKPGKEAGVTFTGMPDR